MRIDNDLISRSAITAALLKQPKLTPSIIRRVVIQTPAADAVEVVRCRDCLFRDEPEQFGDLQCHILNVPMRNDDFCSYGERREENDRQRKAD